MPSEIILKDDTKVLVRVNSSNLGLAQRNWRVIWFVMFPREKDRL